MVSSKPPDFEHLQIEIDGPRGRLILDRPERRNALSLTLLREIADAAASFDAQPDVRVVVVEGRGEGFCAGVDLQELAPLLAGPTLAEETLRAAAELGRRAVDAVAAMRATTIASVHGCAVGGGLLLAAVCDLRVVADDTRMSIPEIDIGIPLVWGGVARLVREIGPSRARELIVTGRPISAEEAQRIGLVHRIARPSERMEETEQLVRTLLDKPALPLRVTAEQIAEALEGRHGDDAARLVEACSDPGFAEAAMRYFARHRKGG